MYRPKEQLLYELIRAYRQESPHGLEFVIFSRNIRFDGEKLGYSATEVKISEFEGTKAVRDLIVYPIEYHPSPEELKQCLKTRGEKFLSLRGIHHKAYRGQGIQHKELFGVYHFSDPRHVSDPKRVLFDSKVDVVPTNSSTNVLSLTPKRFMTIIQMKDPFLTL